MVSRVEILFFDPGNGGLGFVFVHYDESLGDELAAFFLVEAFASRG